MLLSVRLQAAACRLLVSAALAAALTASPAVAGEFHNALSLQGFTGLLNTPNAGITDEGKIYAQFTDQTESEFRQKVSRQENYMFSVGLFSFAELGGRITEARGRNIRDLSANFKVRVPFIPKGDYIPSLAIGMQDVGGGAKHLQTKYLVASEELWRMRLSLGYGHGPDRMKGVFGGVELKAWDWLYVLGENDTKETNLGLRLVTPHVFGYPVNLNVTAKTSLDHRPGNVEFGFGMQFPLGAGRGVSPRPEEKTPETLPAGEVTPGAAKAEDIAPVPAASPPEQSAGSARLITEKLVKEGFMNVRTGVGERGLLVVEYENGRFNQNELDGLGVAAGIAADNASADVKVISLVLKKKDLRILRVSAPLADFKGFFKGGEAAARLPGSLRIEDGSVEDSSVRFPDESRNQSMFATSLVLFPDLKTFVATEVGVFDYFVSVKPDVYLNAWKGAVLNARWDIPVAWSENFEDGKVYRNRRNDNRFERLMLFQAVKPASGLMAIFGGGMILKDLYGTLNEVAWAPGTGGHRLRFKHLYADDRKSNADIQVYLGSYRYLFTPLDLSLEATAGKFFNQDTGFTVEMKRFFGDTALSVYYKNSETSNRQHVQIGGVQFAFPLTPRRDMKPSPVQLRGTEEWSYSQETEIVTPGGRNVVGRSIGVNPQPPFNIERTFQNRDRLNDAYIRKHLDRLRDAYRAYPAD